MKKIILSLITAFALVFSGMIFAITVIDYTNGFTSVPITVDTTKQTYVVGTTEPTSGNYYYTYSGYRCLKTQNPDIVGANFVIFHAGVSGGSDIYCYPE